MAEDLLYLRPECHGSELRLEWPMRGRDGDWGSWKIEVRIRGVRLAPTLVLTVSRRLVGQPEWRNGRAHRETLLFQASCLRELVVYRFGFTYLVGYYVNRT